MPFHHIAITTKDMPSSHAFYSDALGFPLEHVDVLETPTGGWMRHALYDCGNSQLLAIFEFHDDAIRDFRTDISSGLGLPQWANHVAFAAEDLDDFEIRRHRLLDHGLDCAVMAHAYGPSLYVDDPNGVLVEFHFTTASMGVPGHRERALELLFAPAPDIDRSPPVIEFFLADDERVLHSAVVERARAA